MKLHIFLKQLHEIIPLILFTSLLHTTFLSVSCRYPYTPPLTFNNHILFFSQFSPHIPTILCQQQGMPPLCLPVTDISIPRKSCLNSLAAWK